MHFTITADTDIGISKKTNQDSMLLKHAYCDNKEVLIAIICDGMGGLSKGELASATVIRHFSDWFDNELPYELERPDMNVIGNKWSFMLKDLNEVIAAKAAELNVSMGTTFTGILFWEDEYVIVHVGDTRVYHLGNELKQLTEDQTFIAREIKNGNMTPEQAAKDKRRNLLLQCVGASDSIEPQVIVGKTELGVYFLCSDGFRHELTEKEIVGNFHPGVLSDKNKMHQSARTLIELNKNRNEKDNISAALIKVD